MTNITFIDLEINPTNRQILDIGAIRHDGASFHLQLAQRFNAIHCTNRI